MIDGLDGKIRALDEMIKAGGASPEQLKALMDELASMKSMMDNMKGWGDEIAALKRMASTFEKELASLGVDVEQMKKDLASLDERVSRLEKIKMPVKISGDLNLFVAGGHGRDSLIGMNSDGFLTGVPHNGASAARITQDFSVLHEAAFSFEGTNDEGPKWKATLVYGNMAGYFGGQFNPGNGSTYGRNGNGTDGPTSLYFQEAKAWFSTSVAGLGFDAVVGRQGYQISPLIMKRPDTTTFFSNDRWDSGDQSFDGGLLKFMFGNVGLHVFGGKLGNNTTSGIGGASVPLQLRELNFGGVAGDPLAGGTFTANNMLGVRANVPISGYGGLNLAYMWLDSNNTINGVNRVAVFGADFDGNIAGFDIKGGFTQTDYFGGSRRRQSRDNKGYYAQVGWKQNNWGLHAGYKQVERFFGAPGAWGKLGHIVNPTDLKGFYGKAWFAPSSDIKVYGGVQFYEGVSAAINVGSKAKARSFKVGGEWKVNPTWTAMASYEDTEFKNGAFGSNPIREKWFTVGFGYDFGANSMLNIMYQFSDLERVNILTGAPAGVGGYSATGGLKGGYLTTQVSFKF
jgi:polyhydroxyalkanoate synthesis regulator phasin